MRNVFKTITFTSVPFPRIAQFLFILMVTISRIQAQTLSTPTTTQITYESAVISFYFHPNCTNGGNLLIEWANNPSFTGGTSSSYSVSNVGVTRTMTLTSLSPSTVYYWRVTGQSGLNCSSTPKYIPTQLFTTSTTPVATPPTITLTMPGAVTYKDTSASISYSLNANYGATSSIIRYGLSPANLSSQKTGFSASGGVVTSGNIAITGLLPNTTYHFQIEATNSAGTRTSAIGNFKTAITIVPQQITEYTFNNTYNNINGTAPFSINNGVSFVNDRNGSPNSAINIVNTGSTATIVDLPYGAASRTIAMWAKVNTFSTTPYNMLYSYGVAGAGQVNGASFSATDVWHFGYNNNHQATLSNVVNTWYHFVFTYDGINSKIYRNGLLVNTLARTWNTVNNSNIFKLGVGVGGELTFDGAIDELKIYNYALTQNEITSLHANNVITSVEDNMQTTTMNIYPNPAKDLLYVSGNAEIFDLVGNKVAAGSNEINIEHLLSGIYVVKANGKSQKIVKE